MDLTIAYLLIIVLGLFYYNLKEEVELLTLDIEQLNKKISSLNYHRIGPGSNYSDNDILFKTNFDTLTVDILGKLKEKE